MRSPTRPRRPAEAGFTLTEMMMVVVIIGILSALAYTLITPSLAPSDVAENSAQVMREAGRRATVGGPVRGDVVLANPALLVGGNFPRTRLHVLAGTPRKIAVERLQEDPLPASTAQWFTVQLLTLPTQVTLRGWRPTADLNGGVGPSVNLAATDEVTIQCYANAICDAATLYFSNTNGAADKARVVTMPLGGSPVVFESW
jgi:prepilin-type N-terminal cleavage/methylation domain-containing protein